MNNIVTGLYMDLLSPYDGGMTTYGHVTMWHSSFEQLDFNKISVRSSTNLYKAK